MTCRLSECAPEGPELGAAWKARSNGEGPRDYLSVQLDDPSFPEPIRAALFEEAGAAFLAWNRREREG